MKAILISAFTLTIAMVSQSCGNGKENLSEEEAALRDSLSKVAQSRQADSMKRLNPLLILPPDSDYTGDYIDKYSNGIVKFRGQFRFGKRHGQWLSFYPNGEAWSELHYDKGMRQGPNITYYAHKQMRYTGFYKNDKQDSIWVYYDSLGNVDKKIRYREDRIVEQLPVK